MTLQTVTVTLGPLYSVSGELRVGELLVLTSTEVRNVLGPEGGAVGKGRAHAYTGADGTASVTVVATDAEGLEQLPRGYVIVAPDFPPGSRVLLPASSPNVDASDLVPLAN